MSKKKMTSENLKTGPLEPFLAAFGVWPDQPPTRIHGGGRSEVYRLDRSGASYALRILHATIDREGIRYVQRVTDHLSRTLPEVPTLIPTTKGVPFAEAAGRLATLSRWLPGTHPSANSPWLLEASASLLARLHRTALDSPVKSPRPDRPTYQSLDWRRNYLFDIEAVRRILFEDSTPLFATSREEDKGVVTEILSRKSFVMEQSDVWSNWSRNPGGVGRTLLRAPIHGDIYAANLLSEDERITAIIDWDECQFEPLVYELGRVLWEFAKDSRTHVLDEGKRQRFLASYWSAGGPVPPEETDLLVPYICMLRIIESLLYLHNSTTGDFWDARYTLVNLMALERLQEGGSA
jgi:Ser/Thr protein kinase RdoA (MazF antagonist)